MDYLITRHADQRSKVDPKRAALILRDLGTKWTYGYNHGGRTADETADSIGDFQGKQKIEAIYSDRAPEFRDAARQLKIRNRARTLPGIHQSNGIAERTVQSVLNGIRMTLFGAGVPLKR